MYDTTKPYKKQIEDIIQLTWNTPYVKVEKGIVVKRKFNHLFKTYPEYDHTDGIGTKGIFHWQKRSFREASIDALAMNLIDLIEKRAIAYKLQNHIFLPEDDKDAIIAIISYLVEECYKRDIAISGGETSIHNNIEGLETSITISSFIKKYKKNKCELSDLLIGIKSNGLHSNGFTKIREVLPDYDINELTKPTLIYYDELIYLYKYLNGAKAITGGAFTKLKDIINNNLDIKIHRNHSLKPGKVFFDLYEKIKNDEEMYKTFNNGIGYVFSINKKYEKILNEFKDFKVDVIGEVASGSGRIIIESMFSDKVVEY